MHRIRPPQTTNRKKMYTKIRVRTKYIIIIYEDFLTRINMCIYSFEKNTPSYHKSSISSLMRLLSFRVQAAGVSSFKK